MSTHASNNVLADSGAPMSYNNEGAICAGRISQSVPLVLPKTPPADGTVEKAIFSITCTTCQARLAVRSEAAIGAVLECPKCESMVHIVPPEGWTATPLSQQELPASAGPPPLDRVNAGLVSLELEPADASWFGELASHWRLASATALVVVLAGWGLWWMLASPPTSDRKYSTEKTETIESLATEVERSAVEEKRPTTDSKRPTTAVGDAARTPSPPRSQSRGVLTPSSTEPAPSLATPSLPPVKTKPSKPDPFRRLGEEAASIAEAEAFPKEIKRRLPTHVDVAAKLAVPLYGIEWTDMPLVKAIDLLATMIAVPITLDADAMRQLGVGPRDAVSLRLGETTIGDALQAAVAQRGLTVVVNGGQAIVTSPAKYRETLRKIRYTVSDLTGEDQAAVAQLASLVERFVAPESWRTAGGQGTIEPDCGAMTLRQTSEVHRQVLVFCERLRTARRKPLRSRENPEHFTLVTRRDRARTLLGRPVTATFHEPTSLVEILAFLAKSSQCTILIDRAALAVAETSDRVETRLAVVKQPLGTVLASLLRPLGLVYRAMNADTLQVTTKDAADEQLEVEFYPIGLWLEGGVSGVELAEVLKSCVAADTWSDVGGLADAYFDPASRSLIVLQSQSVQAIVGRLLAAGPSL